MPPPLTSSYIAGHCHAQHQVLRKHQSLCRKRRWSKASWTVSETFQPEVVYIAGHDCACHESVEEAEAC